MEKGLNRGRGRNKLSKIVIIWGGIFATVAFLGIIATQYFWISNAFRLSSDQFDHRLTLCLNEIVNEVNKISSTHYGCHNLHCKKEKVHLKDITDILDDTNLKNIIDLKVQDFELDPNYRFILSTKKDSSIIYASGIVSAAIALNPHQRCLEFKKRDFYLCLYFPYKSQFLLNKMMSWIILSILFTIVMGVVFTTVVYISLTQKKLSEIKDDFVDNITHEFKTPISTITIAASNLIKAGPNTPIEKVKMMGEIIKEESERLKTQTEYILDIAKMDMSVRKYLNCEPVNINSLINKFINEHESRDYGKTVITRMHLDENVKEIFADRFHIGNIISNLFENAIKYSNEQVTIDFRTFDLGSELRMEVQDDGIGISKENMKYIFEKFFRCHTGNRHDVKGFGLGLYYVKKIVELHKGRIEIESKKGLGTTLIVHFPYKPNKYRATNPSNKTC